MAEREIALAGLLAKNVKPSDVGTTFLGEGTTYALIDISFFGYEMAILFVA